MLRVVACIALDHNPLLVALAAVICALACLAYINMLGRAAAGHDALRRAWVAAASVVFGCGVWVTHFVAMMGFQSSVAAVYSLGPTAIFLDLVIVGSAAASLAWVQGAEPTGKPTAWCALGGVLIGVSIAAMHCTGMAALQRAGTMVFDFDFVVTSIVIGILLSVEAMLAAASRQRALATGLLVLGICGLHLTAMAGVQLYSWTSGDSDGELVASGGLAVAIGGIALFILLLSLAGTAVDAHLTRLATNEAGRLANSPRRRSRASCSAVGALCWTQTARSAGWVAGIGRPSSAARWSSCSWRKPETCSTRSARALGRRPPKQHCSHMTARPARSNC